MQSVWVRFRRFALVGAALASVLPAVGGLPASAQDATCIGHALSPGDSIQAALSAKPTGTVFCLAPGVYKPAAALIPKTGQQIIGAPGAVLEGDGTFDGFAGYGRFNVVVRGLEIRNFKVGMQTGQDWLVENNNIHDNTRDGARLLHGTIFKDNRTHHNLRSGVFGYGENITVTGNEIDHNQIQHDPVDPNICSQKFVWTVDLVVSHNFVHHNNCPSLWVDINGYNALIEHNVVEDNNGEAIDCEISYGCVIRYNVVRNNNKGIYSASSPNVEIYGNTVTGNLYFGIRVTQQGTSSGIRTDHPSEYGAHVTKNNYVHDNLVATNGGPSGITKFGNVGNDVFSAAANNRFQNNTYYVSAAGSHFSWNGTTIGWSQWKSAGHDTTGSYTIGAPPPDDGTDPPDDGTDPPDDGTDPPDDGTDPPDDGTDPNEPGGKKKCNVKGSDGSETLVGSRGDDVICGMGGNDRLIGRGGNDLLVGGRGDDQVVYRSASRRVRVNLRRGKAYGQGADTLMDVEKVVGSRYADRIVGNRDRNRLRGREGNDDISGGARGDRLYGGAGGDVLKGQRGRDRVVGGPGRDRRRP